MYEKQVDDFFNKLKILCDNFNNSFTTIDDIGFITLQIEKIKDLMKEVFGIHILEYINVRFVKSKSNFHGVNYEIDFIDKVAHKVIKSEYEFVTAITNYNYKLCVKSVGPLVIDIDNELDSKDLNSNKSFEYNGLESVTEKHEKWFGGNKNENKK